MLKSYARWILLCWFSALPLIVLAEADRSDLIAQGRRIYQDGILSSGKELEGLRSGNVQLKGSQAACINCHRRSGMGSVEGDTLIAPITGDYLFHPDKHQVANMNPRSGKKFNQAHPPYNEGSLAAVIATGMNNSGRQIQALMPSYPLEKQDMTALIAYLKQLSSAWSPGVDAETVHLATVITPEVDTERRKIFLTTLQQSVNQKNSGTVTIKNRTGRRHMASAAEMVLGTERKWKLHIWELQGKPETWQAQLNEKLKAEPVFALLSGLSNSTWQPIHNFCEHNQLPCWFPSVPLPVTSESFYALYFSKGVLLEANVLSKILAEKKPKRVLQIRYDDEVSQTAAKQLTDNLSKSEIKVEERLIKMGENLTAQALTKIKADDVLMFWLRPRDLAVLNKLKPPTAKNIYFSTELAGEKLPKNWQKVARLIYPYQLPDKRQTNLTNFHTWHKMKKLPIIDEPLQAEAFFAVEFLTETLTEMLDNLYRDYLIERAENMLSRSEAMKSEQQIRDRQYRSGIGFSQQQHGTSIYPRLGLGVNQRFASKGAYIVHYDKSGKLVAESDWIVP